MKPEWDNSALGPCDDMIKNPRLEQVFDLCSWKNKFKMQPPSDKKLVILWEESIIPLAIKNLERTKEFLKAGAATLWLYEWNESLWLVCTREKTEN